MRVPVIKLMKIACTLAAILTIGDLLLFRKNYELAVGNEQQKSLDEGINHEMKWYYTKARHDRYGRQLLRFFALDALAFRDGVNVGGICPGRTKYEDIHSLFLETENVYLTQELLRYVGLDQVFPYECPEKEAEEEGRHVFVSTKDYEARDSKDLFTPEWIKHLRAKLNPHIQANKARLQHQMKKKQVAVHIRRGDITPCEHGHRYFPNSFYLNAIDVYLTKQCTENIASNCNVTIYSESDSAESFGPFLDRGFNVNLDGTIEDALLAFITADVLFASASAFSYAPALLNENQVIFIDFQQKVALSGWTVIESTSELTRMAEIEKKELYNAQCEKGS